jgi:hypothetical protein
MSKSANAAVHQFEIDEIGNRAEEKTPALPIPLSVRTSTAISRRWFTSLVLFCCVFWGALIFAVHILQQVLASLPASK